MILTLTAIFTLFVPHNKKLDSILQAALTEGRVTPELRAAMDDKTLAIAHHFEEAVILIIAALMMLKPF